VSLAVIAMIHHHTPLGWDFTVRSLRHEDWLKSQTLRPAKAHLLGWYSSGMRPARKDCSGSQGLLAAGMNQAKTGVPRNQRSEGSHVEREHYRLQAWTRRSLAHNVLHLRGTKKVRSIAMS
jgi:hypothetical protein